jgi:hypothetical protein
VQCYANLRADTFLGGVYGYEFWEHITDGTWEMLTLRLIADVLLARPDSVYVDVGAWIGPTVLVGAQFARRTLAFEPDPRAFSELRVSV